MRNLFIIGCPRSGSTLLQQILVRHPEVVIPPETAFFTKLLTPWPGRFHRQLSQINADLGLTLAWPRRPTESRDIVSLYNEMANSYAIRIGRAGARWFGEKTPDHLGHARSIADFFPEACFVLIYRDGRDVALSLSRVPWAPADPVVNFGVWLDAVRRQDDLRRSPPAPTLSIRYEDLVHTPEAEVGRIAEFLDIEYLDELLQARGSPRGVPDWEREWKAYAHEPIRRDRIGVWRNELTPGQISRIERWGGETLSRLGYELSDPEVRRSGPGLVVQLRRAVWRVRAVTALLAGRR